MRLKTVTMGWVLALGLMGLAGGVQAALIDRGNGMIYDDVLDVTWLQDANYAKTSGYHATGLMTWSEATTWAANLSYGGYDDWRLPTVTPIAGGSVFNTTRSVAGTTDWGYNISAPGTAHAGSMASEMAYMFYNNLGGQSYWAPDDSRNSQWGLVNGPGFFTNLRNSAHWSGTEVRSGSSLAWVFDTGSGSQYGHPRTSSQMYAWAVRSGDVAAVPLPAAAWLFGSGLAGLLAIPSWRRRRLGSLK